METEEKILISEDRKVGNENFPLEHGNEIEEIISSKPPLIVRWGTVYFFILLLLIAIFCEFISYPDIVNAKAKLTSINAPKEVKIKTEGKLVKLNATEGKFVQQGQLLGFMESRANHNEVIMLDKIVDSLQSLMQNNRTENIPGYLTGSFDHLGEVQQNFQTFMQSFNLFRQYLLSGYYLQKKGMLHGDIDYLAKLHSNLLQQKTMQEEDLGLAQKNLDANKSLNDDKVISALDYRNERSKYISKALTIPQIESAIISNESSQHEKQKEIAQLENEIAQQKGIFSQSLNTLKASLEDWKSKYILVAPIDGKVAFNSFFQENQQLQVGQTLCFINPENTQYFAEVYIPQNNFGKIKQGQKVLLKLPAYPYQEFGALTGTLDIITNIPTDSGYVAKVTLPNGLQTNYKKQVQYHEGLLAGAEIITKDQKLSNRLLNQFKSLIKN